MSTRPISRRHFAALLATGSTAVALGLVSRVARAQAGKPQVEIMVLHARQEAKGHIDPQVAKLSQLTQPPFSAYNTYVFLDKKTLPLDQAKPSDPWKGKPMATYALLNGKTLEVALLESLAGGRFQMGAAIGQGVQPDLIKYNAPANEPVFIAGQSYNGGILVVGITLRP
jgi:hypothetical protein